MHKEIIKSEYGGSENNFHLSKRDDTLIIELTYPPRSKEENKNNQVMFVEFDQESVRASDGIRVNYDYQRDGYSICQPKNHLFKLDSGTYDTVTEWIETAFCQSWHFENPFEEENMAEAFKKADEEYARTHP